MYSRRNYGGGPVKVHEILAPVPSLLNFNLRQLIRMYGHDNGNNGQRLLLVSHISIIKSIILLHGIKSPTFSNSLTSSSPIWPPRPINSQPRQP
ncbi:hypothetical protein NL676_016164 [Syzygium grande]|nr:hypothetical protein NL676_016164 [Syzygium grande]